MGSFFPAKFSEKFSNLHIRTSEFPKHEVWKFPNSMFGKFTKSNMSQLGNFPSKGWESSKLRRIGSEKNYINLCIIAFWGHPIVLMRIDYD